MYSVAYDDEDVVIRFNQHTVDKNLIANFLACVELEQIRKKSKLTEEQAELLAKKINTTVWEKLKSKVLRIT